MKKTFLFIILSLIAMSIFAQTDTLKTIVSGWDEFKLNILGDNLTLMGYISAYVFVTIGLYIKWYIKTKDAVKNNVRTPEKFSWKYWIWDNLLPKMNTMLFNVIIVFVCLRFCMEWWGYLPSMGVALAFGVGFDFLIDMFKKKMPDVIKAKENFIKDNQS